MVRRRYSNYCSQLFQRTGYLYGNGNRNGWMYGNGEHFDHPEYNATNSGYHQYRRYCTDMCYHIYLRNSNGRRYLCMVWRSYTGYSGQLFQCTGYLYSDGNRS